MASATGRAFWPGTVLHNRYRIAIGLRIASDTIGPSAIRAAAPSTHESRTEERSAAPLSRICDLFDALARLHDALARLHDDLARLLGSLARLLRSLARLLGSLARLHDDLARLLGRA